MLRHLVFAALLVPALAVAQAFPVKPLRMIVSYPPGGGADTVARLLAPKLGESLGQSVVVENRPGATGAIAADLVAKAAPDGYTLMLDASGYAVNPSLYPKLPYDASKAFSAVTLVVLFPNMLVVNPGFAAKSVQDLVAMAKAQPGKIAFASSGNGSAQHLAAELFRQRADIDMLHVPYKGGGPALIDVMGGQVPVFFANMASGLPHVKSGKLRALAVTSAKRVANAPDLPTIAESGVPGYAVYEWNVIVAPAGTPAAVLKRLHAEVAKALKSEDVRQRIVSLGGEIAATAPDETDAWLKAQIASWAKVVKTAGIRID